MDDQHQNPHFHSCPDLGAQDDPSIACSYPSVQNTCFHCRNTATPIISHQVEYCLTQAYVSCPVYKLKKSQPFPQNLLHKPEPEKINPRKFISPAVTVLVAAILLFVFGGQLSSFFGAGKVPTEVHAPAMLTTSTPRLLPTETSVPPTPTRRARPTVTLTTTLAATLPPGRNLDLPFTIGESRFLIHKVLGGETLVGLASKYSTTVEVINAVNTIDPAPLWVGRIIVISPGMMRVDPALPTFEPYEIPDKEISLIDLAARVKVDAELLRYYTACDVDCVFKAGDWIIIPRLR